MDRSNRGHTRERGNIRWGPRACGGVTAEKAKPEDTRAGRAGTAGELLHRGGGYMSACLQNLDRERSRV